MEDSSKSPDTLCPLKRERQSSSPLVDVPTLSSEERAPSVPIKVESEESKPEPIQNIPYLLELRSGETFTPFVTLSLPTQALTSETARTCSGYADLELHLGSVHKETEPPSGNTGEAAIRITGTKTVSRVDVMHLAADLFEKLLNIDVDQAQLREAVHELFGRSKEDRLSVLPAEACGKLYFWAIDQNDYGMAERVYEHRGTDQVRTTRIDSTHRLANTNVNDPMHSLVADLEGLAAEINDVDLDNILKVESDSLATWAMWWDTRKTFFNGISNGLSAVKPDLTLPQTPSSQAEGSGSHSVKQEDANDTKSNQKSATNGVEAASHSSEDMAQMIQELGQMIEKRGDDAMKGLWHGIERGRKVNEDTSGASESSWRQMAVAVDLVDGTKPAMLALKDAFRTLRQEAKGVRGYDDLMNSIRGMDQAQVKKDWGLLLEVWQNNLRFEYDMLVEL